MKTLGLILCIYAVTCGITFGSWKHFGFKSNMGPLDMVGATAMSPMLAFVTTGMWVVEGISYLNSTCVFNCETK